MIVNRLLVKYAGGYLEVEDLASIGNEGITRERMLTTQVETAAQAEALAWMALARTGEPQPAITVGIEPTDETEQPYTAFIVGDLVTVRDLNGSSTDDWRVVATTVGEDDMGNPTFTPELNRRVTDPDVQVAATLQTLGSTAVADPVPPGSGMPRVSSPMSFRGAATPSFTPMASPSVPAAVAGVRTGGSVAGTEAGGASLLRYADQDIRWDTPPGTLLQCTGSAPIVRLSDYRVTLDWLWYSRQQMGFSAIISFLSDTLHDTADASLALNTEWLYAFWGEPRSTGDLEPCDWTQGESGSSPGDPPPENPFRGVQHSYQYRVALGSIYEANSTPPKVYPLVGDVEGSDLLTQLSFVNGSNELVGLTPATFDGYWTDVSITVTMWAVSFGQGFTGAPGGGWS